MSRRALCGHVGAGLDSRAVLCLDWGRPVCFLLKGALGVIAGRFASLRGSTSKLVSLGSVVAGGVCFEGQGYEGSFCYRVWRGSYCYCL
jgi:hypothetical protein